MCVYDDDVQTVSDTNVNNTVELNADQTNNICIVTIQNPNVCPTYIC